MKKAKFTFIAAVIAGVAIVTWAAVTALDSQTAALKLVIEAPLLDREADASVKALAAGWSRLRLLDDIALLPVFAVFFGGLPIALLAIAVDRLRNGQARPQAVQFACYTCFVLQLVSMFVSAMWVALALPFWNELSSQVSFIVGYFVAQLVAGLLALPAWRRAFEHAAATQLGSYFFRGAAQHAPATDQPRGATS